MTTIYIVVSNPPEISASIVEKKGYADKQTAEKRAEDVSFGSVQEIEVQE